MWPSEKRQSAPSSVQSSRLHHVLSTVAVAMPLTRCVLVLVAMPVMQHTRQRAMHLIARNATTRRRPPKQKDTRRNRGESGLLRLSTAGIATVRARCRR
eukprot:892247-Pleurochrysis_carterae.AAC.1